MSYTKNTWATGDTITAAKLNNIEDGIANAGGYDLVFVTTETSLSFVTTSNTSLESGTFANAYAKALAGDKLSIRFHGYSYVSSAEIYACEYDVSGVYADVSYNDAIRFYVTGGYEGGGSVYGYARYASSSSGGSPTTKIYGAMDVPPIQVVVTESGFTIDHAS